MDIRKNTERIPEFKSPEEEKEYWNKRGPLAPEHRGKWNTPVPKEKRSSFLTVRLTGKELDRLFEIARERGEGPSTFARKTLISAIESRDKTVTYLPAPSLKEPAAEIPQILRDKLDILAKDMVRLDREQAREAVVSALYTIAMLCSASSLNTTREDTGGNKDVRDMVNTNL